MANPAPGAVTAFATTSFMLGMYQTHLLNNAGILIVLPAAFFFGGLVQIIVAIMEFSRAATCSPGRCSAPTARSG
jgi:succinate-acetate transporter protein